MAELAELERDEVEFVEDEPQGLTEFPHMMEDQGVLVPHAPSDVAATGIDSGYLAELALKIAHRVPQCSTKWVAEQMRLPMPVVEDLMMGMKQDHLVDVVGREGPFNHRFAVSARGHERALQSMSVSRYVGPAPVSLELYSAMIELHQAECPEITFEDVQGALSSLVLPEEDVVITAAAVISQRSLFLFGAAGNGKTSIARLLHEAIEGELWIPYAIAVDSDVIQLFDPQVHSVSNFQPSEPWKADQRWVRIRRPLIVTGGEMTLESLELSFTRSQGFYEAPLHVKANGGTFVIDDFGRQRVDPWALLNRWIIPMEHGFDYLTLQTGRKLTVPFQQMLVVATNIDPDKVMDPAFLRRMGYRVHVATPSPNRYREIFEAYAHRCHVSVPEGLVDRLLQRYGTEGRELRCCEPRDLIGRTRDICLLRRQPLELNDELLELAWCGYFGTKRSNIPPTTVMPVAGGPV